jgi:signal transduction histidine kinase
VQRRILRLEEQSALERERSRIAADIHDALGADFSRVAMLSERLREDVRHPTAAAAISETIRAMGQNMSELIWATNSRNDTLDNLISYLREHTAAMCDAAGLRLIADTPRIAPRPVTGFLRHNVYLIFREALNNVVKHAEASEVRLRVGLSQDILEMELEDNGRGFNSESSSPWRSGQINLRKRAANIHAHLEITSRQGIGTSILLRILLTKDPDEKWVSVPDTSAPPPSVS